MNLLLLLSALLSALTGAVPGVRRAEAPQAVAQAMAAAQIGQAAVTRTTLRPTPERATLASVATGAALPVALFAAPARWMDRRRE